MGARPRSAERRHDASARHRRPEPPHLLARHDQCRWKPASQRHRFALAGRLVLVRDGGDHPQRAQPRRDPRCTLSVATHDFDLVAEGEAHMVTDRATVAMIAERYAAEGWPARVDESGTALTAEFSAPSAGKPPWHVYQLQPKSATALCTVEPGGATRWRF